MAGSGQLSMGLREWEVQLHTLYDPSHVYKGEEEDGKEKKRLQGGT